MRSRTHYPQSSSVPVWLTPLSQFPLNYTFRVLYFETSSSSHFFVLLPSPFIRFDGFGADSNDTCFPARRHKNKRKIARVHRTNRFNNKWPHFQRAFIIGKKKKTPDGRPKLASAILHKTMHIWTEENINSLVRILAPPPPPLRFGEQLPTGDKNNLSTTPRRPLPTSLHLALLVLRKEIYCASAHSK